MNQPRGLVKSPVSSSSSQQKVASNNFTGMTPVWGPIPSKRYNAKSPIGSNTALPDLRNRHKTSPSNRENSQPQPSDAPNDKVHARSSIMTILSKTRRAICCSFSCFKCCQRHSRQHEANSANGQHITPIEMDNFEF